MPFGPKRPLLFATACALLLTGCGQPPDGDPLGAGAEPTDAGSARPPEELEDGLLASCNESEISAHAPSSAAGFLSKAYNWVNRAVPYCECVTSESSPYRADCSGYVSYIWGLPSPGDTTYSFAGGPWDDGHSVRISWSELTTGDALNFPGDPSAGTGHVMLFAGWLDSAHTHFCSIEEYNYGHPASILDHWTSDPGSWWGGSGTLGSSFLPIRKAGYVPTPATPPYDAVWSAQDYPSEMTSGETIEASLAYENTGSATWNGDTRVGTTDPRDRNSLFAAPGWIRGSRPASVEASTPGGAIGHFRFALHAPDVATTTTFIEHWGLVQEGVTWFGPADDAVWFEITVHPRYSARLDASSYPSQLGAGQFAMVAVDVKNTGTTTWRPATTRLGTRSPEDRASPFADPSWLSSSRPAAVAAPTPPGGIGHFVFLLHAPPVASATTFVEQWGVVEEGVAWMEMSPGPVFTITVDPASAAIPEPTVPASAAAGSSAATMQGGCSLTPHARASGGALAALVLLLLLLGVRALGDRLRQR